MNISFSSGIPRSLNPSAQRKQFGVGSLIFLIIFGGIFAGGGFAILNTTRINPSWTKATGTIVAASRYDDNKGSTTYSPTVRYTVNNESYTVTSSLSTSSLPVIGDEKGVAYNPSDPSQAKVIESAKMQWFLYIFPAVGLGTMCIAVFAYIRSYKRTKTIERLLREGAKLQGILTDIQTTAQKSGTLYTLIVSATNPAGQVQAYASDTLTGIGALAMADFRTNPVPIDIYVSQTNPADYYVDISHLPSLSPERIKDLLTPTATEPSMPTPSPQAPVATPTDQQPPNQVA